MCWVPSFARLGVAKVSFPGGCAIGPRPVDLHLKGLQQLGAEIEIDSGYIIARTNRLVGTEMYLRGPHGSSVGATANVMMAATLAEGTTIIRGAACEPEVADLANFLNAMGADIKGVGTSTLTIHGVKQLHGTEYTVISRPYRSRNVHGCECYYEGRCFCEGCPRSTPRYYLREIS